MVLSNELLVIFVVALILAVILISLIPRSDKRITSEAAIEEFPDKQVVVSVDPQGFPVRILRLPYAPPLEMKSDQDEFNPTTILLNVVVARQDDPDRLVTKFEPPLKLTMAYSAEVLQQAQAMDLEHPIFGFWDGCKWVKFTREKHGLDYQKEAHPTDQAVEHALVSLSEWSDPALGRGP